jgi:hypothetical protein
MSVRLPEPSRAPRATYAKRNKLRSVGIGGPSLPDLPDDSRVMTFAQWCEAASISQRTGRRLLKAGLGPTIIMLTSRRIGVMNRHHREWLAQRAR